MAPSCCRRPVLAAAAALSLAAGAADTRTVVDQLNRQVTLTTVNVEALLALHPDVVFVTNYVPPAMLRQIEQAGLPVVVISLSRGEGLRPLVRHPSIFWRGRASPWCSRRMIQGTRFKSERRRC